MKPGTQEALREMVRGVMKRKCERVSEKQGDEDHLLSGRFGLHLALEHVLYNVQSQSDAENRQEANIDQEKIYIHIEEDREFFLEQIKSISVTCSSSWSELAECSPPFFRIHSNIIQRSKAVKPKEKTTYFIFFFKTTWRLAEFLRTRKRDHSLSSPLQFE